MFLISRSISNIDVLICRNGLAIAAKLLVIVEVLRSGSAPVFDFLDCDDGLSFPFVFWVFCESIPSGRLSFFLVF